MAKRKRRAKGKKDSPTEGPSQFVTKEEFDKSMSGILDAIKNIGTPVPAPAGRAFSVTQPESQEPKLRGDEASAKNSNYTLNPAHQAIFEEYFDPEDGFVGRLEYPYFTIIVPMKFSNADAAWQKYYKVDSRMKFLKHDNIEGGLRDWCKMVATNLKYDRHKKLK